MEKTGRSLFRFFTFVTCWIGLPAIMVTGLKTIFSPAVMNFPDL
jgi:hypothetical protein